MDNGKGEFQEWATKEMERIGKVTREDNWDSGHEEADAFLLRCVGACLWPDEADRIEAWFKDLPKWYS